MLYAKTSNGRKLPPTPGLKGICPHCESELIPKCGRLKMWHWAHLSEKACDSWSEPESDWHRYWKNLVEPECAEVTIEKSGQRRRADIWLINGVIVELQHSSISVQEIEAREQFYGKMIWLFDLRACYESQRAREGWIMDDGSQAYVRNFSLRPKDSGNYHTFRWRHPRLSIAYTTKPTYLDLGEDAGIFRLRKMSKETPCGGWGILENQQVFESWLLGNGGNHADPS